MNAIAVNGGTAFDTYFLAADGAELNAAFQTIAQTVVSCTFELDEPSVSADPDKVNFYFDDVVVPYDENCLNGSGWAWADDPHTAVEFCDTACDQLLEDVSLVSARFRLSHRGPVTFRGGGWTRY